VTGEQGNAARASAARAVVTAKRDASGQEEALEFSNGIWTLGIKLTPQVNPHSLRCNSTGSSLADEDYCYSIDLADAAGRSGFAGGPQHASVIRFVSWSVDEQEAAGRTSLTILGRIDFGPRGPTDLFLEHVFTLHAASDAFEERIRLRHLRGRDTHVVSSYRFGFRKRLFDGASGAWVDGADRYCLGAVPLRRRRGQAHDYLLEEYTAADLVPANWSDTVPAEWGGGNLPNRASEAWSWYGEDHGFCIAKYSQDHIEFAIADGEFYTSEEGQDRRRRRPKKVNSREVGDVCFRFGGAGATHGAPGVPIVLDGEQRSFAFGATIIVPFEGTWEDGHRRYAQLLRERGHVTPPGFDPPVHWNELYELGWRGGSNSPLQELPQIWEQAEVARAIGAQALYFDPGWDTFEGSCIWDTERLGPIEDFIKKLSRDYGLSLSLHLMIHTKSYEEDPDIYRRDANGNIVVFSGRATLYEGGYVCAAYPKWQDLKTARLEALAEAGVSFFMFDFCDYAPRQTGCRVAHRNPEPCMATNHGHDIPLTLEAHSNGVVSVIKRIKRKFPHVLIEAHDRITGGLQDYLPLYYEHGPGSFDEHWGFEYMWTSHMDLLTGRALSLYEYNLAYDIPLYLHINLDHDNRHALSFWWYASTCRHLGIGGVRPGHPNWDVHVAAMAVYRGLKPLFARGRFLGIDRMVHGHVLDDERRAVFVLFNLTSTDRDLTCEFPAARFGLPERLENPPEGLSVSDGRWSLKVRTEGLSPRIIEVHWA
jgi:hypothetical protein